MNINLGWREIGERASLQQRCWSRVVGLFIRYAVCRRLTVRLNHLAAWKLAIIYALVKRIELQHDAVNLAICTAILLGVIPRAYCLPRWPG